jgi:hypothetical protein
MNIISRGGISGVLRVTAHRFTRPLSGPQLVWAIANGLAIPVVRKNMVVDIGLDDIAAMLGGGQGNPTVGGTVMSPTTYPDLAVEEMRITEYVAPTAPAAGDTALQGATLWAFNIQPGAADGTLTVTYPGTGQVKFSGLVPIGDLNGKTLTEEGLFTFNDKLIARTTFSKPKTSAFALQFDHTLTVSRA